MILTNELISALATDRGGFTKATLLALGVFWDSIHHTGKQGWKRGLIGKEITPEDYEKALKGRTISGK